MIISNKISGISASPTLAIDAKFKEMKASGLDVVGFGAGEPDFDTPQNIKDAAIKAINEGFTKYTPASGTLELKKAVAKKFLEENNLKYEPSQIVISNGAKHSLVNALMAILNPGDEVILPAPYWVSYEEMIKIADGVPYIIETTEENDFKFTPSQLENAINEKTKALILNSPSNPTGMVYTKEELEVIADICVKHDVFVISDEIYEKLIYDGEHISIGSLNDEIFKRTITINGVSKSYAMTGWRIGYAAAPAHIAKAMSNLQSHAASNPNSIAQAATLEALNGPQDAIYKMREVFAQRRINMCKRINSIEGVSCKEPQGAFYIMMNIKKLLGKSIYGHIIDSSDKFAELFLQYAKVAVVPTSGFGADGYVRWSYATSEENINEGLNRLEEFLKHID